MENFMILIIYVAYAFKLYKLNKIRRNKTRFKSTLVFPLKKNTRIKTKSKRKGYYIIDSNQTKVLLFKANTLFFFLNLNISQNIKN